MPSVNSEILRWARETAGLSLNEASQKLGLRPTKARSSTARLSALESGETAPSRTLLEKMAKQYRRPLVVFYMSGPPRRAYRGEDFRTLPEDYAEHDEALLDALIRDVRARQSMVRALMEEEDEAVPISFVGSVRASAGTSVLLHRIAESLDFDLLTFRADPSPDTAFSRLRTAVQDLGVFVLLLGDLGSHHSGIPVETFRGIALSDPYAPFIVINDRDARSAWSFTLIHELAHLWLGQSGVSAGWSDIAIETLCSDVASQFLLPTDELRRLRLPRIFDLTDYQHRIGEFARSANLSSTMIAYRLRRRGALTESQWLRLHNSLRELWAQSIATERARNRSDEGGPNYYIVRRHRLGTHLIEFVARMLRSGELTTTKAGRVLGVSPTNVHKLIETVV